MRKLFLRKTTGVKNTQSHFFSVLLVTGSFSIRLQIMETGLHPQ